QMARKVGLDEEAAEDLISRGVTLEQASAELIDKLAERQQSEQPESRSAHAGVTSDIDLSVVAAKREAMQNALLHRCNPKVKLE
ncbi:hypothetical protein FLM99_32935, partial [Pseudomonas aeruginosa]